MINATNVSVAATAEYQQQVYSGWQYAACRPFMRWARYDSRYRIFLMEELFKKHAIPFEHQRVFELGFGTGDLLFRFDTTSTIHGCEIAEKTVEAMDADPLTHGYADAQFLTSKVDGTPRFPSKNYDIVLASHVLEHVPDDAKTLKLLWEHTRPGGYGLFFLPLERPRHNPDHARTYTSAGLKDLLVKTDWDVLELSENNRYGSHIVQVINWPSRAKVPLLGCYVEAIKGFTLALPPTSFVRYVEEPLKKLHVAPYQLMALVQKPTV